MVASRSVSERLWLTDNELGPIPLSILLLAAIGVKLIVSQDGPQVGKRAVHEYYCLTCQIFDSRRLLL